MKKGKEKRRKITLKKGQKGLDNASFWAINSTKIHLGPTKPLAMRAPKLPPRWLKKVQLRTKGLSAGKWEVVLQSPEGKSFRSKLVSWPAIFDRTISNFLLIFVKNIVKLR